MELLKRAAKEFYEGNRKLYIFINPDKKVVFSCLDSEGLKRKLVTRGATYYELRDYCDNKELEFVNEITYLVNNILRSYLAYYYDFPADDSGIDYVTQFEKQHPELIFSIGYDQLTVKGTMFFGKDKRDILHNNSVEILKLLNNGK